MSVFYAIELLLAPKEAIEVRLAAILKHLIDKEEIRRAILTTLDATGPLGEALSKALDSQSETSISTNELKRMFEEDGQIIEMNLIIESTRHRFQIIIVDGQHVNIISDANYFTKKEIIGDFIFIDPTLFTL